MMDTGRRPIHDISKYIYEYPEQKVHEFGHIYDRNIDNLTIGDLHGNPVKLIHILIDYGIMDFPSDWTIEEKKQQYQIMVESYHQDINNYFNSMQNFYDIENYYEHSIKRFFYLLATFQFSKNPPLIRMLGDILADRGRNDFFTLMLLHTLSGHQISFEINLSNHDEQFIQTYLNTIRNQFSVSQCGPYDIRLGPANSLENMGLFLSEMKKSRPEKAAQFVENIIDIIDHIYLPKMKFINYEYNEDTNTFSIFTHAPVGLITIELLAMQLKITYDDSNVKNLITTIESINERLSDLALSGKLTKSIIECQNIYEGTEFLSEMGRKNDYKLVTMQEIKYNILEINKIPEKNRNQEQNTYLKNHLQLAIYRLIWERVLNKVDNIYDETDMPKTKNGINFKYGHGHDTPQPLTIIFDHITNFDSIKGKFSDVTSEKHYFDMTFSQSDKTDFSFTAEDYIDHSESKGFNSSLWPAMREINRDLTRMNQILNDHNPNLFFQFPIEDTVPDPEKIKANIKKLPKTIADEYTKELQEIMSRAEKIDQDRRQHITDDKSESENNSKNNSTVIPRKGMNE